MAVNNSQDELGFSLIPIKGISRAMRENLKRQKIFDVPSLLILAKTPAQRASLATRLKINVQLVNAWLKQAELWRVPSITSDDAYLLVQIGVRHVYDLSRMDVDKAYP